MLNTYLRPGMIFIQMKITPLAHTADHYLPKIHVLLNTILSNIQRCHQQKVVTYVCWKG